MYEECYIIERRLREEEEKDHSHILIVLVSIGKPPICYGQSQPLLASQRFLLLSEQAYS